MDELYEENVVYVWSGFDIERLWSNRLNEELQRMCVRSGVAVHFYCFFL